MYDPYLKNDISETSYLIYKHGTKFNYKKNQIIFKPGDKVNDFYYVDEGSIRYLITSFYGVEHVIMILKKGGFFGAVPLSLGSYVQNISLVTETPTVVYKINKKLYNSLIKTSDDFRDKVIAGLSDNVSVLINQITNLSFTSAKERLYDFYLNSVDIDSSSDNVWYGLNTQFTQEDLASIIGVSRMSIYKIIKELCEEDFIRIINRRLEVKMC